MNPACKYLTFFSLFWIVILSAQGSPQKGDDLIANGQKYQALGFKLTSNLRIKAEEAKAATIKAGKFGFSRIVSDGMIFDLEIRDDTLFITAISISGENKNNPISPLKLPTGIIDKPIFADWFTGELEVFNYDTTKVGRFIFEKGKLTKRR